MKWSKLDRHTRRRAQWIARAREGDQSVVPHLLKMAAEEELPLWRAVATHLLRRWAHDPSTATVIVARTGDADPLVRANAANSLESTIQNAGPAANSALRRLLDDPVRLVRVQAAWTLRESLDPATVAGKDLLRQLENNQDQPTGALQLGVYRMSRGELDQALVYLRRAVSWDPGSAPLRQALAVALSTQGKAEEAVKELEEACRLDPQEAEYRFKLGLAWNEAGKLQQAASALEEAVKIDPSYARAWYNLGLAYSELGRSEDALKALSRAETVDGTAAIFPYSRATILARMNRISEARAAAGRALSIDPGFHEAAELVATLDRRLRENR
jgi:tetratricopeptide (TPR) repeat protein